MGLALEGQLLADLGQTYREHGSSVTVHELPMPAVLRDGIGTHWMLPGKLDFADPADRGQTASLSDAEVLGVVRDLFREPRAPASAAAEQVQRWTCVDPGRGAAVEAALGQPRQPVPPHAAAWVALTGALGISGRTPCFPMRVAAAP
jgi:hypothetical protein